ncbi:restriction endonuclease subunit S [Sporosarcina oncorhynchi]|uniref:Restriction endonuclease subunit S n=1 Tax=Sporosarcina oncorhynchi TaxID=3056444 RepID=A0ABZ0L240_9BACL|nr:restriction endonuclease subunit S [Sporosarcina sp. T2O-4]WOV86679.1 restriction endonuclease subunit S [Sporosarcina sp. T2O-4]
MRKLSDVVEFVSGSPQFRITEVFDVEAPLYTYYGHSNIDDDLVDIVSSNSDSKQVRTQDRVNTLDAGDIIFSLISGNSTIVRKGHEGYLYTQNYVKLIPAENIDSKYLVYLLNEDKSIRKQFLMGLQGSQVLKYTLRQVKELEIPKLPQIGNQQIIGEIYFNQLRLQALRNRAANNEKIILLEKLKGASKSE